MSGAILSGVGLQELDEAIRPLLQRPLQDSVAQTDDTSFTISTSRLATSKNWKP